jgi:4'-phosphopantetheinyl transferase
MIDDPAPVDLWWYRVSEARLDAADLAVLNEEERAKAAAFLRDEDRDRYQLSHVALRQALARYVDTPADRLRFAQLPCPTCGKADRGRPVLVGGPHFSLSHSGDLVGIAVARVPVGLDVERAQTHCMCQMTRYMHADDRARVAGLTEPERHEDVLRWWVRIEALGKCRGDGIGHGLGKCPVLGPPAGTGSRVVAIPPDRYALLPLAVPAGFEAAVAVTAATAGTEIVVRLRP